MIRQLHTYDFLLTTFSQKSLECWLHISTDSWTSPNQHTFIALMVHLEKEGIMKKFLLDFIEVPRVS
jgi:hypothetical protein